MVSFDVNSLFTNVPLDRTIQLVLKRIYEKHEISTNITKQERKEMLILCTNIPVLWEYLNFWKGYVDDTICFVKIGTINYIITILDITIHYIHYITFTYEVKKYCKLPFLDVLLIKKGNNIVTTLYRKATNNYI